MAIKKANQKDAKKAEFKGFFNYELKADEKEDCKTFLRQEEEIAIALVDALASQYKFTMVADKRSGGVQATMQSYDPDDVNAGLCMSAYARHWYDALGVLLYKHTKVLGKNWSSVEETPSDEDFG